jgi:hypothetical protein
MLSCKPIMIQEKDWRKFISKKFSDAHAADVTAEHLEH